MATLFNTKIKDTYQSLLKLEDNTILTTTVKNVTDGLGNASPLYMSTTRIGIGTNAPTQTLDIQGGVRINSAGTTGDSSVFIRSYLNAAGGSQIAVPNELRITRSSSILTNQNNVDTTWFFGNYAGNLYLKDQILNIVGTNVLIGTTTDAGYKLDVNGTVRIQNTLRLNSNFEIASSAVICGISRVPGNGPGMIFTENMQSGQIPFQFASGYNSPATKGFLNSGGRSILNINIGLGSPNADNLDASVLLLDGIHNVTSATGTTIRGIYYNPTITSLTGVVAHRAIETTSGDIVFNGGNVLIGTSTNSSYKLDVNGSTRVKANSLTLSASGLSSPPANYVGINFDDSGNHHQNWFAINSKADPGSGITTGYNRIIFPTMGASNPATWNFNALGAASAIQLSAVNSTTGNYLTLSDSSISFVGVWNVVSIDRTNRKLVFGNMVTDVNHLAVYDVVIKGAKPNEGNYGGAASNGGNVYVVGGTPATSPTGNYGNVILAHDGTAIRGNVGIGTNAPTATTHIKGAGSTSATSSLLVQNSSSTRSLEITDDGNAFIGGNTLQFSNSGNCKIINNFGTMQLDNNGTAGVSLSFTNGAWGSSSRACFGDQGTGAVASAQVEIKTTTRGFLPPRMTNAQKLAINLPAAGLQVYDTTLNQMSYFNGTTWVNF